MAQPVIKPNPPDILYHVSPEPAGNRRRLETLPDIGERSVLRTTDQTKVQVDQLVARPSQIIEHLSSGSGPSAVQQPRSEPLPGRASKISSSSSDDSTFGFGRLTIADPHDVTSPPSSPAITPFSTPGRSYPQEWSSPSCSATFATPSATGQKRKEPAPDDDSSSSTLNASDKMSAEGRTSTTSRCD